MPPTATHTVVFPGEQIPSSSLPIPSAPTATLKLGPGLVHKAPSVIIPTTAGTLHVDKKRHIAWVENTNKRYAPTPSDPVIATVQHSSGDHFYCTLTPYTPPALLGHLEFPNATKKTRPQLTRGALVYARVATASPHFEPTLVCINPSTGKADGLGELKGGMLFEISLGMARRLLMPEKAGGVEVLDLLAEKLAFEVAVGRNGRIWVNAEGGVKATLCVGRAVKETDEGGLDIVAQKKLVAKMLKDF